MFPAFIEHLDAGLEELTAELLVTSGRLGAGSAHPLILEEISRYMLQINSYYTNSMEGNPSKLKDIENALNNQLLKNKELRNFQLEHLAHIHTQKKMFERINLEKNLNICGEEFLCFLHHSFYSELPPEMKPFPPGHIRTLAVQVGRHIPPETEKEIKLYLNHFSAVFGPTHLTLKQQTIALASSHHRLLWIHPFQDGNGRIARLFTTAFCFKIGLNPFLLWNVTRAFARSRKQYDDLLANADLPRRNDLDGRGPLSEETLIEFCKFFLTCCIDQIKFMEKILLLPTLEKRFQLFLLHQLHSKAITKTTARVLERIFKLGKISRGEIREICNVKERRSNQIAKETLLSGLCQSPSPHGPLSLKITTDLGQFLFPDL